MTTFTNPQTKTRPANTTAYAINDVISDGTVWAFNGIAKGVGNVGYITTATLALNSAESTALQAELFLFHTEPTSTQTDNSADAITAAEIKNCVGSILFNDGRVTTNRTVYTSKCDIQFSSDTTDQHLYGVLLAKNTYTPVSGEVFDITLDGIILR